MKNTARIAFDPFARVDLNKPFKLIPTGTWYRGERTLDITEDRLREIAGNMNAGLPNYRVPINLDHADNQGKVGEVKSVAFMPDGEKGPGLYVTEYELSEAGQKAVEDSGYDAVSAEIVWTLNGSKYQDPTTGAEHDNVLVGVALTPYPYFGHQEVSLYSEHGAMPVQDYRPYAGATSFEEYDGYEEAAQGMKALEETGYVFRTLMGNIQSDPDMEIGDKIEAMSRLVSEYGGRIAKGGEETMSLKERVLQKFRTFSPEKRQQLAKEGKALPDGSFPIVTVADLKNAIGAIGRAKNRAQVMRHIKRQARALGATDLLPEDWTAIEVTEEVETMAQDEIVTVETPETEPEITPETVPSEQFQALSTERDQAKARVKELEEQLIAAQAKEQKELLEAEAKSYKALGLEVTDYVEKMSALRKADPILATWVKDRFTVLDAAMVAAGTLVEIGSELEADLEGPDAFYNATERIVKTKFNGDMSKWAEAIQLATKEYPRLAAAYAG